MSRYGVESVIDFGASGFRPYKSTEAISQREQLKNMVLKKYMNLYGKKSQNLADDILKEVNYYFYNQNVNEAGIRILKQRIENMANNYEVGKGTSANRNGNTILAPLKLNQTIAAATVNQQQNQKRVNEDTISRKSDARSCNSQQLVSLGKKIVDQSKSMSHNGNQGYQYDQMSMSSASSRKPKSVFYLEGRDEDEWAQLVQFDAKMFQKEQEMQRQRQQLVKQKLKSELDKQLREKQDRAEQEKQEHYHYIRFQDDLIKLQEEADLKKEQEKQSRLDNEKQMREKQKHDIKLKRRQERLREKDIDDAMIKRILQEQNDEEINRMQKKEKEKLRQNQMLIDNQINKQKQEKDLLKEKHQDMYLQQQYAKLLDDQEDFREKEKKERYDKIQKLTKKFENTIQKDMKDQIKQEDDKMLQHIIETNQREDQEQNEKKKKLRDQKVSIRQFLDNQMREKNQRQLDEEKLNQQQAEIWEKDREYFLDHETKKINYISNVNKEHQKILIDQMRQKDGASMKGKMSIEELKQNKDRIQRIVDQSPNQAPFKHSKEVELKRNQ